ncbi:hypothetical protein KM043_005194 [Ampulex compressa]|nr:hypothetical protein KM043_005194 [Ampulex compressa]
MTVQSQVMTWLMLGEMFQKEEVSIETDLMSEELFFPVSKTEFFEVKTNEERIITSVIAASIHMQGYVTVLSGGINHTKVERERERCENLHTNQLLRAEETLDDVGDARGVSPQEILIHAQRNFETERCEKGKRASFQKKKTCFANTVLAKAKTPRRESPWRDVPTGGRG